METYSIEQLKDLAACAELFDLPNKTDIYAEISRKEKLLQEDYWIARDINFDLYCKGLPNDWKHLAFGRVK